MTPTEKKYSKLIGKLCWVKSRRWTEEGLVNDYSLGMISHMTRGGWRGKGPFEYRIHIINKNEKAQLWVREDGIYRVGAASFEYFAVDKSGNPPEDKKSS